MKLPFRSEPDDNSDSAVTTAETAADAASDAASDTGAAAADRKYTAPKGRPTPSRKEAQGAKRGPVAPAPVTRAEARARRKELGGPKLSREERKAASERTRTARAEARQRMMDGDEKYLMARDKGPVKAFIRDIVDSRRNLAGLFLPFAIVLLFTMFIPPLAGLMVYVMMAFVVVMIIDAYFLGRRVNRLVHERFDNVTDRPFSLGFYAFTRSMQLRRMRAPKPRVTYGEAI